MFSENLKNMFRRFGHNKRLKQRITAYWIFQEDSLPGRHKAESSYTKISGLKYLCYKRNNNREVYFFSSCYFS